MKFKFFSFLQLVRIQYLFLFVAVFWYIAVLLEGEDNWCSSFFLDEYNIATSVPLY